jgi:hypothetical protein
VIAVEHGWALAATLIDTSATLIQSFVMSHMDSFWPGLLWPVWMELRKSQAEVWKA